MISVSFEIWSNPADLLRCLRAIFSLLQRERSSMKGEGRTKHIMTVDMFILRIP